MTTEDHTAIAPIPSGPRTALQASSFLSIGQDDRNALYKLANAAVASGIYPNVQNPDAAFLVMLKGADLGLAPQESLSSIYLIRGKAHVGYTVLASLLRRHPRYDYRVDALSAEGCTVTFTRDGEDIGAYSFTEEDRKRAGLGGGRDSNWQKYPTTMLFARALSLGQRIFCPDLTSSTVYVETHGEYEVPMQNVTPAQPVAAAVRAIDAGEPVDLFGPPAEDEGPSEVADLEDVDEWLDWARERVTPAQAETALAAVCEANDGEFIHLDFQTRIEAIAAQGRLV